MIRQERKLTVPKDPELLKALNEMSICIKLHHIDCEEKFQKPHQWAQACTAHKKPTWEEVEELIQRAYNNISEQRDNPRKY